jgi:hypothetical protein
MSRLCRYSKANVVSAEKKRVYTCSAGMNMHRIAARLISCRAHRHGNHTQPLGTTQETRADLFFRKASLALLLNVGKHLTTVDKLQHEVQALERA